MQHTVLAGSDHDDGRLLDVENNTYSLHQELQTIVSDRQGSEPRWPFRTNEPESLPAVIT